MAISAAAAAWITAISAAASVVSMAMAMSARGKAGDIGSGDIGQTVSRRGVDNPAIVPFGQCIVPASRVFTNVTNYDRKWLTEVFALGHGPFKEIQQVFIDEQPLFNIGGDLSERWFRSDAFNSGFENIQVGIRRGNHSSATWGQMVQYGDGLWTNEHRGDGIGTISFLIERPNMKGKSDSPYRVMAPNFQVSAQVQGLQVIDPRLDPSLQGWTNKYARHWGNSYRNPALCLLTYLADPEWGFSLKPEMVDIASFVLLANWCDQNGIHLDGYIDQSQSFGKILDAFTSSFGGYIFLTNGMVSVLPDTTSPVMFNVTENDLVDNINLSNNGTEYYNCIKVDFQNQNTKYCKDTFVLPADSKQDQTIQQDGRIFEDTMDCPLSTDPAYIRRVANRELKRAKLCRKSITLSVTNTQFNLRIGRVFTVQNKLYNLDTNTKWRITKLESSLDKNVLITKISAEQYDDRVYDTTSYDDGNLSGSLPRPDLNILPVTDLTFVQNSSLAVGSGVLSWQSQYYGDRRFIVQYRLTGSNDWVQYGEYPFDSVMIQGLRSGKKYDFRVQTVSSFGGSVWTTITNQVVNRTINLPAVANLTSDFTSVNCVIQFEPIKGPIQNDSVLSDGIDDLSQVIHYYKIDVQHNTGVSKTYQSQGGHFVYTYDENLKNGLERRLNITVTPISIWGDVGESAIVSAYNAPMDQASGVSVVSELITFTVNWDNRSSDVPDYRLTNIYIKPTMVESLDSNIHYIGSSSTGSFTKLLEGIEKGWVVVEDVDAFGSAQPIIGSNPIYFETKTIDDLLTDSPSFNEVENNLEQVKVELTEQGGDITELQTKVALHDTSISENKTLIETTNTKLAQVETTVAAQDVIISDQTQAISNINGTVSGLRTIKLDVNGKISGLQLGNDGETSTTDFLTDVFRVSHGTESQAVFEIRSGKVMIKNALIGDLTATNIRAGSITGNEINSTSIIRAGSGNTSATLDGTNPTWRLYAGNTNPDNAPFRVNTSGILFATGANISGHIVAHSGSFTGAINAQSGQISGYLGVGNSYISGDPNHNFIHGANGRFVVDRAGNMTCQHATIYGGTFNGRVSIENLVGDVYRKDVYQLPVRGTTNVNGHHQQVNFFVAHIGSQPFAQRVIFSHVDVPFRLRDQGGKGDLYCQVGDLAPLWIGNIEGAYDARKPPYLNYHVHVPAYQSQIRFYLVPYNMFAHSRGSAIDGVIETMKWQTVGVSVGDGW